MRKETKQAWATLADIVEATKLCDDPRAVTVPQIMAATGRQRTSVCADIIPQMEKQGWRKVHAKGPAGRMVRAWLPPDCQKTARGNLTGGKR